MLQQPTGPYRIPRSSALAGAALRLSVVVPTYREANNIASLVTRLAEVLDPLLPGQYEIIVVDDDSPDRTWEIVAGLCATMPALRVMRREGERGLSSAVIRGWQA